MADINYLLHREQVSLVRASSAQCAESRASHESLARNYREKVEAYREYNRTLFLNGG